MKDLFFKRYYETNQDNSQEHVQLVGEAIWDLSEHFEVSPSDKRWGEILPPKVEVIIKSGGMYMPCFNSKYNPIILLSRFIEPFSIGHEAGHFMHNLSFPEIYKKLLGIDFQSDIRFQLREGVAAYSELIFNNRNNCRSINPIKHPGFSLVQLASMDPSDVDYKKAEKVQNFTYELASLTGLRLNPLVEVK